MSDQTFDESEHRLPPPMTNEPLCYLLTYRYQLHITTCEYCKQLLFNKSSLTGHINKGRCDTMSLNMETKQMLDAIKLLKDSNAKYSLL